MKILKIRKKYCIIEVQVDDHLLERLSKYRWKYNDQARRVYRTEIRKVDNWRIKCQIFLHRQLMGVDDKNKVVFKDGNSLNCQRSNLLIVKNSRQSPNFKEPDCSNNGAHHHKIRKLLAEGEVIKRPEKDRWAYYDNYNMRVNQHGKIEERWVLVDGKWKIRWKRPG